MPKRESEFNAAVRKLVDDNQDITYEQARPLLKKMGLKIARHPGRVSSDLSTLEDGYTLEKGINQETLAATMKEAGLDPANAPKVLREIRTRVAFKAQANVFNVTKSNRRKAIADGTATKPEPKAEPKAKRGQKTTEPKVTPKKRGRPKKETTVASTPKNGKIDDITAMLALVQKNGGVQGATQRVAELQAEIAELEAAIRVAKAAVQAAA